MILVMIISLIQFFKSNIIQKKLYSRTAGTPWKLSPRKTIFQHNWGALELDSNLKP